MSASITLIGNLTRDPELKFSKSGTAWTKGSVAVNFMKKDKTKETSFYDFKVFGEEAQNYADLCNKGDRVVIQGELKQETYTNSEGVEVKQHVVNAREIALSTKYGNEKKAASKPKGRPSYDPDEEEF